MGLLDGLIGFVPNLLQSGLDWIGANHQNKLNEQAWMQQQEYNSPANQMARYKAAGLNPNLIYGQGTSGNASSAPVLTSPLAAAGKDLVKNSLNSSKLFSQIELNATQIQKQQQTIENLKTQLELTKTKTDMNEIINRYLPDVKESEIYSRNSGAANALSQVNQRNLLNPLLVDKTQTQSALMRAQIGTNQTQQMLNRGALAVQTSQVAKNLADTMYKKGQTQLLQSTMGELITRATDVNMLTEALRNKAISETDLTKARQVMQEMLNGTYSYDEGLKTLRTLIPGFK